MGRVNWEEAPWQCVRSATTVWVVVGGKDKTMIMMIEIGLDRLVLGVHEKLVCTKVDIVTNVIFRLIVDGVGGTSKTNGISKASVTRTGEASGACGSIEGSSIASQGMGSFRGSGPRTLGFAGLFFNKLKEVVQSLLDYFGRCVVTKRTGKGIRATNFEGLNPVTDLSWNAVVVFREVG